MLSTAGTSEDIDGEIGTHFIEVLSMPGTERTPLIEKGHFTPLAFAGNKLGTADGFGELKYAIEIVVAELSENAAELIEESGSENAAIVGRRDLPLTLRRE